jgi:membrane-associated phospholipid phosphatase
MNTQISEWLQGVVPHFALQADQTVALWFRDQLTTATRADFFLTLSLFGSSGWTAGILLLLLAYLACKKHWNGFFVLVLTVPCGALLGQLFKHLFQRSRPFVSGPWGEWGGHSFPSGHTLAATLLYAALLLIFFPKLQRKRWRFIATCIAGGLITAVALSRVALGAHYLTDVMAAMMFGTFWASMCALAVHFIRQRRAQLAPVGSN